MKIFWINVTAFRVKSFLFCFFHHLYIYLVNKGLLKQGMYFVNYLRPFFGVFNFFLSFFVTIKLIVHVKIISTVIIVKSFFTE
jgi:hypothetical protein